MIVSEDHPPATGPDMADSLAAIHAAAFADHGRAWSAPEILSLISDRAVRLRFAHREHRPEGMLEPSGFALFRVAADEAELLTIAVAPWDRRLGLGAALLEACTRGAALAGAARMFLEVAEGNAAACALYARAGFTECGRRRGYYETPAGREDALVLELPLQPLAES